MKETYRFWASVSLRLVLAMMIPLYYSQSQGFLVARTIAYGMIWVHADGLVVSPWSLLAALILASSVVAYALFVRRDSKPGHSARLGLVIATLLLLLPLLGIAHPAAQDLTWEGSPYLFPFGFCVILLLLFVVLPAMNQLLDSQHLHGATQTRVSAAAMLLVCLLSPFAFEDYYGVLGVSERSLYWCFFRLVSGRWGLTNENTFELTKTPEWSSALVTYDVAVIILVARLLYAGLFILYVRHGVRFRTLMAGAVVQELFVSCAVLASSTGIVPEPYVVWTLLPLPAVLPVTLVLVWLKSRLGADSKGTEDDDREYVAIPLAARIRSLLTRRRRR